MATRIFYIQRDKILGGICDGLAFHPGRVEGMRAGGEKASMLLIRSLMLQSVSVTLLVQVL